MRVRFWGVRGSVPWATATSIGHGCNTPCVELCDEATGAFLILDAGSGIVGLGEALGSERRPAPIVLTHYHWDHLQGLPFFAPFYQPGWSPTIWAPVTRELDVAFVDTIFQSPFFPVPYDQLPSRPSVTLVGLGSLQINGFSVRVQALTHPGGAFAYRIKGAAGDLVYATDHEFGNRGVDSALTTFAEGAAAIILDAHFTPDEIEAHRGWGHASWRECADFARAAHVGQLHLFHHKPGRSDVDLERIETQARRAFPATSAAREGVSFEI